MLVSILRWVVFFRGKAHFPFLATAFFSFIFTLFTFSYAGAQDVPEDFSVTLVSAPNHALTGIEVGSVTIDARGKAEFSAWRKPNGTLLPEATVELGVEAVKSIYEVIEQQNFFELEEEYSDPNIQGGDYAVLRVTAQGQTHEVISRNMRVWPFDLIAIRINRLLPTERELLYNSLLGAPYKEVK